MYLYRYAMISMIMFRPDFSNVYTLNSLNVCENNVSAKLCKCLYTIKAFEVLNVCISMLGLGMESYLN